MKKIITLISITFFASSSFLNAQNVWVNNGATVMNTANVHIVVKGGVINQNNGTFDNSGTMHVTGDWTNNANNTDFINSSPGKVILEGATQQITGTNATTFNILELAGTGTKQLRLVSTTIEDSLILNDKEFDLDTNTAYVTNTNVGIITRTTGFCSSLVDGGLARNTNSISSYLFPVGSSVGTPRYRPIDMKPTNTTANTFKVRMANVDASTESYNITNIDTTLCSVNNLFYHRIYQLNGTSSADITMYYDSLADGYYNTAAHWQNTPRWEDMLSTSNVYAASPSFSTVTKTAWSNFSPYYPYALALTKPIINVTTVPSTPTVCIGDTIQFHATPGMTNYDFYVNGTIVQSSTDSILLVSNLTTGDSVYVIASDWRTCNGVSNVINSIIINPAPTVTITSSPSSTLCVGDTLILTGNGATTYSWNNGITDNTPFVVTTSNNYIVTGFNGSCSDTAQISITVNTLPIVTATASPPTTLCIGDTLNLTGNGATTYSWTNGVIDNTPFVVTTSSNYIVTGTDANGCSDTAQISITVNPPPTVTITSSPSSTLCVGDTLTLTGNGATTYSWNNGITDNTPFVVTTSSNYIVTGANGSCSDTAQISIIVNTLPTVTTTASPMNTLCVGDTLTLTGNGASTYSWNNGITDNTPFIASTSNNYIVTGTDANGCSDTAQIAITVNALPTVTISATNNSLCSGDSTQVSANGTATSFLWNNNSSTTSFVLTPTADSTLILTGTDANGCSNIDSLTISLSQSPTVIVSNDTAVCLSSSIQLNANGSNISTIIWNNGSSLNDSTITNPIATPTSTTTYIATVSNGSCSSADTITISVLPNPTLNAGNDTTIISGGTVNLNASSNGFTFIWSPSDWLSCTNCQNPIATPEITTEYYVTVTDANVCITM